MHFEFLYDVLTILIFWQKKKYIYIYEFDDFQEMGNTVKEANKSKWDTNSWTKFWITHKVEDTEIKFTSKSKCFHEFFK